MPQFNSLRSWESDDAEQSGSRIPDVAMMTPVPGKVATSTFQTDAFPGLTTTEQTAALQVRHTDNYPPIVLQNAQTTQSLVLALHATIQQPLTQGKRQPIVIPGDRKRQRDTEALRLQQGKQHGLTLRVRHGLVMLATFAVLMFTMLTMTPLGSGQSGVPLVDSAVKWAQTQQENFDLAVGRTVPVPAAQPQQPAQAKQQANPVAAPPTLDTTNLPKSQYVAIAQQAAMKYGISPVYFVRQINQESGFNPYAMSPVGAVGIAQFLPSTAAGMGVNPYDPVDALYGAARMMSNLSNQYGGDYAKALAAYNAGSGSVDNAVAAGGAAWLSYLPAETQNYVRIIMG
ncbi:lytic transglycosylase domain-containing protein [Dictyobacter aurantiacus]|uniref:Transglycosylase SLT domain-containing protein n=1 Tax=Dictyobacter aurantiacus TaxID=1936993 RepID=A0A401ZC27_9CHLR|nr:lytic transglycosylase domain-containing protein [Dictyobacter aurantiacus]GCE04373.1 hypothetical protein KDAU_17020 [Dictyobacter aurantiacus]